MILLSGLEPGFFVHRIMLPSCLTLQYYCLSPFGRLG